MMVFDMPLSRFFLLEKGMILQEIVLEYKFFVR